MTKMIFISLPVSDLPKAQRFYEALGFENQPRFTDETAAAMQWSETIFVMLLTHAKWQGFTTRPICPPGSSEVSLALTCDSKADVDRLIAAGGAAGGTIDVNPPEDHGFMYQRSLADPDGHILEPFWMDPAVASGDQPVPETAS
ncbi:MAG: lactoylglutathione lyase [Sphingomonadales bacterium]|nr:lactoylglutathione lyase [Sphingomonadales bacterium]